MDVESDSDYEKVNECSPFDFNDKGPIDFGVQRISVEEQERLLLNAAEDSVSEFNNSDHEKNYQLYEENGKIKPSQINLFKSGKIPGYCKSQSCKRDNHNNPVHSAPCGPFIDHHCFKCLAKILCESRRDSRGSIILIQFDFKPRSGVRDFEPTDPLSGDTFQASGKKNLINYTNKQKKNAKKNIITENLK